MLDDQILNMKMEIKLGKLIKICPQLRKNIGKILFKDIKGTCSICV
jgi:hypothetical protein